MANLESGPGQQENASQLNDALLQELLALTHAGNFQQVIVRCQAVSLDGTAPFALVFLLGYAYHQTGHHQAATSCLRTATGLKPGDFNSNFLLANSLRALGEQAEALHYFVRASDLDPFHASNPLAIATQLLIECEQAQPNSTLPRLTLQARQSPAAATILMNWLFLQGQFDDLAACATATGLPISQLPTVRRISSIKDWVLQQGGHYQSLGDPEPAPFTDIAGDGTLRDVIQTFGSIPYVAELEQVVVIGGSSLILAGANTVLSDDLAHPEFGQYVNMQYERQVIGQRPEALLLAAGEATAMLAEGIMLSGAVSEAYGHWLTEFLPKLQFLEQHPRFRQIPIIVDAGMPASHYDSLRAITDNPVYLLPRGQHIKVGRLIVSPPQSFFPTELLPGHQIPAECQNNHTVSTLRYLRHKVIRYAGEDTDSVPPSGVSFSPGKAWAGGNWPMRRRLLRCSSHWDSWPSHRKS